MSWATRLFARRTATIRNARSAPAKPARLGLEPLEAREVPAYLSGGSLVIEGTTGNDVVSVTFTAGGYTSPRYTVVENGRVQNFSLFQVTGDQVTFRGRDGNDTFTNNSGLRAVADGGNGDDALTGGWANDYLVGGNGADTLRGGDGNDQIVGGNNTVVYVSTDGADTIYGGNGDDLLSGNEGDDWIYGESGRDTLSGQDGNDRLDGGGGNDDLYGYDGDDTLFGGTGNDYLGGSTGNDIEDGGAGDDRVFGGPGGDVLSGGDGNDTVNGHDGNDTLAGDGGNDTVIGENGSDTLDGGDGDDILLGAFNGSAAETGGANDLIAGGHGNDRLWGGDGDDTLRGDDGNDLLVGQNGDDLLRGGLGVDDLYGEAGNDSLFGGISDWGDRLYGGAGGDRFLVMGAEDAVTDLAGEDARVWFENSPALNGVMLGGASCDFAPGYWDNALIENVDVALGNLHAHTGNTRLLKKYDGGETIFVAAGAQTAGAFPAGGWNDGTRITFVDLPNQSAMSVWRTVYHEIGHNWDESEENMFVPGFRELSGWTEWQTIFDLPDGFAWSGDGEWIYYVHPFITFARTDGYGQTNPHEDYATTWESYFVNAFHGGNAAMAAQGLVANEYKLGNLDLLFDYLRSA